MSLKDLSIACVGQCYLLSRSWGLNMNRDKCVHLRCVSGLVVLGDLVPYCRCYFDGMHMKLLNSSKARTWVL